MGRYKDFKDKFLNRVSGSFIGGKRVQHTLLAVFFFLVIFAILATSLSPEKYDLSEGQRVPTDIRSPKDVEDRQATERLEARAEELVEPRYRMDPMVHVESKKEIENFFLMVREAKAFKEVEEVEVEVEVEVEETEESNENSEGIELNQEEVWTHAEKIDYLKANTELGIERALLEVALNAPLVELRDLEGYISEMIAQNMNVGIKPEDLQREKTNMANYILGLSRFDDGLKELGILLAQGALRPNQFADEEVTRQKIDEAVAEVEKVMIRKGDHIVREGDILNGDQLEILRELGLLKEESRVDFILYSGIALVTLVLELIIIAYIYVFNKELLGKTGRLMMIGIIVVLTLILAKAIHVISIYLIPVAASAMLLSILIDSRLALLVNVCLTILISMITGNDIPFMAMALVGGTVGAFSVINSQQRANVFLAGIIVSIANMVTIMGIGFINSNELIKVMNSSFYGGLNGIGVAVLAIGSLPLWESLFGILTPLKLLELSNPNHPLLKRLLLETPGTYHHSIIVGNLSESAADAIGGNALLARVGTFYHDIGKLKRPYFFKENQLTLQNPHDKLNPAVSSMIITDHVKDGMELAKKYNLPQEIRDFIEQHHGDTLVAYFYHKAKEREGNDKVDEMDYRYPGPKPQSKETAILMLADSVEAAVRSLSSPTREKVSTLVEKIINDKIGDRQLEECNITLKEIEIVKETFTKIILGIFHERIEYPELDPNQRKGKDASEPSH
ncbi:metal dependent phosphohydrolase [Alkaliphilus metalliredigens QYMF]|uniref:Metal dependent phosphohydrolase n=1 Tax=Alkaliphilus metalliredigens (strain QYMF) TaxID=293826 RepID=A6TSK4_ALKMQ|nr:HDIG domain-containing metalloprotein [Alkaliphilus metalliredigens]ABR49172.1 metal dependent phosphohydrolase [Alkaliphilus metalliredigens QYMF]